MCSPLPLRICCRATMAPALTEAATHTPPSRRSISDKASVVDESPLKGKSFKVPLTYPMQKLCTLSKTTLLSLPRMNGDILHRHFEDSKLLLKSPLSLLNIESIRKFPEAEKQEKIALDEIVSCFPRSEKSVSMYNCVSNSNNLKYNNANGLNTMCNMSNVDQISSQKTHSNIVSEVPSENEHFLAEVCDSKKSNSDLNRCHFRTDKMPPFSRNDVTVDNGSIQNDHAVDLHERNQANIPAQIISVDGNQTKDTVAEVDRRRLVQEKRTLSVLRRLKRLQATQINNYTSNQMGGFVVNQLTNLEHVAKSIRNDHTFGTDINAELLQSEDIKNMSTASLVALVRKLQTSGPQSMPVKQRVTTTQSSVIHLDPASRIEIKNKASNLTSKICRVETGFDSDVTENSSGGESCDEDCSTPVSDQTNDRIPPLHNRARWKWSTVRSEVAARWTWLHAQVSDLEYKIRQQSDIYRQLRTNKGPVTLGKQTGDDKQVLINQSCEKSASNGKPEMSPSSLNMLMNNIDCQASKLSQTVPPLLTPVNSPASVGTDKYLQQPINGLCNSSSYGAVNNVASVCDMSVHPDFSLAARCRPLLNFRKRKLLRTFGLHQHSRKAARLSTVKCQCYPPVTPCSMCGGRYNNTVILEPDQMPFSEKVALLDNSFHHVLSFPHDVPLRVHFESVLKSGIWQHSDASSSTKQATKFKSPVRKYRKHKLSSPVNLDHGLLQNRGKKLAQSAASILTQKYRTKYKKEGKHLRKRGRPLSTPKNEKNRISRSEIRKKRAVRLAALKKNKNVISNRVYERERTPSSSTLTSPRDTPPLGVSANGSQLIFKEMKDYMRKRRVESDYDINNIVIPYSIAASTRVTKLEYKEIVTPKWRILQTGQPTEDVNVIESLHGSDTEEVTDIVTHKSILPNPQIIVKKLVEEDEELENLSDTEYCERHLRCEIQEKQRFLNFQHLVRRTRSSRTDSGTATPDPLSPECSLNEATFTSLTPTCVASPPTTPLGFIKEESRRRSSSVSSLVPPKRDRSLSNDGRHFTSGDSYLMDFDEMHEVAPWDQRLFPLSEEEYASMKEVMESTAVITTSYKRPFHSKLESNETPGSSRPASPTHSTSAPSSFGDTQENEWSILDGNEAEEESGSIVLKLHRR